MFLDIEGVCFKNGHSTKNGCLLSIQKYKLMLFLSAR